MTDNDKDVDNATTHQSESLLERGVRKMVAPTTTATEALRISSSAALLGGVERG
jgi:hypothetical protein